SSETKGRDMGGLQKTIQFLLTDNWPITAVVVLGCLAVYALLPRALQPRHWIGLGLGLCALVTAGLFAVGPGGAAAGGAPEVVLFSLFAAVAVVSGILLVTQRNSARAALSFALVVLSTCGLFLLQAAPFLAAATAIVYAGAIVVTFLFVIMLAQQEGISDADFRSREPLLSAISGFILLGVLLYVLQASYDVRPIDELIVATDALISELNRATSPDDRDRSLERAVALTKEYQKLADKQPNLPHSEHLREAWKRAEEERDVARMADLLVGLRNRAKELKPSTG